MKWKTRDGRVMEISDMTDSHLSNAFNMVYRDAIDAYKTDNWRLFDTLYTFATSLSNELKQRGQDWHSMEFNTLEEIFMEDVYDDDIDFGPIDHYEAMHHWKGD